MCGIIGYTGKDSALTPVIEGLRRLEYRGYDSAGIAIPVEIGKPLFVEKIFFLVVLIIIVHVFLG